MPLTSPRRSDEAARGFRIRAVRIRAGCERSYDEAEWRDAVVFVRRGEVELECVGGTRRRFERGDVLWLAGLPLRALHSRRGPVVLVAVSRSVTRFDRP
jgi:hypothetical protein